MLNVLLDEYPEENFVFSPISISTSLVLTIKGTRTTTFFNLLDALGFDHEAVHADDAEKLLLSMLQMLNELKKKNMLRHRNFFFINSQRSIEPAFMKDMQIYHARVHKVDFQNTIKATTEMEHMIPEKIKEKIQGIISPVNPKTFLLLVNYIFLNSKDYCKSYHFGPSSPLHFLKKFHKEGMYFQLLVDA